MRKCYAWIQSLKTGTTLLVGPIDDSQGPADDFGDVYRRMTVGEQLPRIDVGHRGEIVWLEGVKG